MSVGVSDGPEEGGWSSRWAPQLPDEQLALIADHVFRFLALQQEVRVVLLPQLLCAPSYLTAGVHSLDFCPRLSLLLLRAWASTDRLCEARHRRRSPAEVPPLRAILPRPGEQVMEAPAEEKEASLMDGSFALPTLSPAVPPYVTLGLTVVYTVFYSLLFIFVYVQLWLVLRYRHKRFSYQTVFLFLCLLWSALRAVLFSFYFKNFVTANTLGPFPFWLLYCFPVCLQFFTLSLMNLYFAQVSLCSRLAITASDYRDQGEIRHCDPLKMCFDSFIMCIFDPQPPDWWSCDTKRQFLHKSEEQIWLINDWQLVYQ